MILLPDSIFLGEWIGCCRSHILYICHWGLMAWSVDQGQTNPTTGEPRPANLELPTFKHINHMYSLQSEHTRSVFSKENIAFSFCKEDKHQLYKRPNEKFFLIFPLKHKSVHYVCNLKQYVACLISTLPRIWALYTIYQSTRFRFGHFQGGLSL